MFSPCGCLGPCFGPGRVDNPYPISYIIVIGLLLVGFVAWRWIRPPPHPLLRFYAGVGATVVFASSSLQTCAGLTDEAEPGCLFILSISLVVIASLYLEIWLWWRGRRTLVPRAIARRRRLVSDTPVDPRAA